MRALIRSHKKTPSSEGVFLSFRDRRRSDGYRRCSHDHRCWLDGHCRWRERRLSVHCRPDAHYRWHVRCCCPNGCFPPHARCLQDAQHPPGPDAPARPDVKRPPSGYGVLPHDESDSPSCGDDLFPPPLCLRFQAQDPPARAGS